MIKLRTHHILCLKFYQGKGYNEDFINNMNEIVQKANNNSLVQLVDSCDDICKHCNRMEKGICLDRSKVERYDNLVKKYLNVKSNETINFEHLSSLVQKCIFDKNLFDTICLDCIWSDLCHKKTPSNDE